MATKLLTIPEFARATGLSEELARTMANRGDIPTVRVRTRLRINQSWVEEWVRGTPRAKAHAEESAAA